MEEKIGENKVKIYPSDWRWSATIVGLIKYFRYLNDKEDIFVLDDDFIEFDSTLITEEDYLRFAESFFKEFMHHTDVEDKIQGVDPTEEEIKFINEKLAANTVMKKVFKSIKFDGENAGLIEELIGKNRQEIVKQTFKGGRALYYNYCNENNMFSDRGKSCRLRGYSVDMGKKSKSVSYMRDKSTFVYQDSKYFDFIPFAFSKTREAFFINNNFTIEQLIHTNKDDLLKGNTSARSQLFFKMKASTSFIDYDVEVIKKEREKDYFETIFVRKQAIKIFSQISDETIPVLTWSCNAKRSEHSQDIWLNIENMVTESILNGLKLDDLIERLFKAYNDYKFLISHLIKINQLIYEGGDKMTEKQKQAYAAAMAVKEALKGRENKLRAYEQRLISALTLKDYDRVQELLLHLSAFTQVGMSFLIDVFKDFEANKNLVYTFINALGEKKKKDKGED